MILTCQKCTKRYLVDSDAIGKDGRTVRCVACGHTWTQPPIDDNILSLTAEHSLEETLREESSSSSSGLGWGWATFIVTVLSLAILFITGRDYITRQWPAIQPLYQALGFTLLKPGVGLVIKNATLMPVKKGEHNYFVVKGEIVNTHHEARAIPPLRFYLRGNCSEVKGISHYLSRLHQHSTTQQSLCILKTWTHNFTESRLLPGEKIAFETVPHEVLSGAKTVEVRF